MNNVNGHEKGYYWGIGYAVGFPLFFALGLILNKMALFTAIGLIVGFSLGLLLEKKFNKNPSEMSIAKNQNRKRLVNFILVLGTFILVLILIVYSSV